ncbi:hypothetical protein J6590_048539 [Homalodisca vitripennis]|nr:hypothetical protein J6590_048539 [Homalodisca vitripennis]
MLKSWRSSTDVQWAYLYKITTNGRLGGLLARAGSLSSHPTKEHPCSTLLDLLSRYSRCILSTIPLARVYRGYIMVNLK